MGLSVLVAVCKTLRFIGRRGKPLSVLSDNAGCFRRRRVLLVDKTAPRGQWLVGRILQTFPDEKGCVRTVSVRTKNGVVKRPIAKLCLVTAAPDI